ncbi:hypothetical protein Q9252_03535 [Marinobacter salarius]|uniref:hypothetical protein n=1 Tax=Marinobacter salarius TaxID=1420917 RepID=UPI00273A9653|nr:hypothetical protein [Marinobacter salarius]MDP4531201.1 hypothetical protein [Marinobacter salarius]
MFGLFKSKPKEVVDIVRVSIANASATEGKSANSKDASLVKLSKKITQPWLESLPKAAIDGCQPSVLAAYVLVAESQLYAEKPSSLAIAHLYIGAARLATKGIGFRAAADQLHESDYKILKITAKLANQAGLSFYDELLEVGV